MKNYSRLALFLGGAVVLLMIVYRLDLSEEQEQETACLAGEDGDCIAVVQQEPQKPVTETNGVRDAGALKKSCDAGSMEDCANLAFRYEQGRDVKRSMRTALRLYEDACKWRLGAACERLGFLYLEGQGVGKNLFLARRFFRRGCDLSDAHSCYNLGYVYATGMGVSVNAAITAGLFQRACALGLPKGCETADR